MIRMFCLFIFFFLINSIASDIWQREITTFDKFKKIINELEREGKYSEAIDLIEKIWNRFPERRFDLIKEREYLNDKTFQYEKNLDLWEDGHKLGYFFLLNNRMSRFKKYVRFSRFDSLIHRDSVLRKTALETSQTIYSMVEPVDYDPEKTYPLLIILHGGGSNLEMARKRWRLIPELKGGYLILFIQSYRYYDSKTFGWKSSDLRAYREIRTCFNEIVNKYAVDTTKVLIGGTSAGGTMAFDLAFNDVIPVRGIIAFCPGYNPSIEISKSKNKSLKVYMLGGEQDYYLLRQKELAQIFDQAGIKYKHEIIPEMGHGFPNNYKKVLMEALLFLSQ